MRRPTDAAPSALVTSVSTGDGHTCATRHGVVLGANLHGPARRLGHVRRGYLRDADGRDALVMGWATTAAGFYHRCATRTDDTVWCWGTNFNGQLGDGTTTGRAMPTQAGTATTWASIAAGGSHTCATRRDGTLWCWGWYREGQLGTGDTWSPQHVTFE
jgi:hypothetical protein